MSQLDYCNSLYHGLDQLSLCRLQLAQNAAVCMLTGRRHDHIAPVLSFLHLLPVGFRIQLKILLNVLKA